METKIDLTLVFERAREMPPVTHAQCLSLADALVVSAHLSYSIGREVEEDWILLNLPSPVGPLLQVAICKVRPVILKLESAGLPLALSNFIVVNFDSPLDPVRIDGKVLKDDFKYSENLDLEEFEQGMALEDFVFSTI